MTWAKVWQFIYRPTPPQRLAWSWISVGFAFFFLIFTAIAILQHRWGFAVWNGFLLLWNTFFTWLHYAIYEDWKKNQKGVDNPE